MAFALSAITGAGYTSQRESTRPTFVYQNGISPSEAGIQRTGVMAVLDMGRMAEQAKNIGNQTGNRVGFAPMINNRLVGAGAPVVIDGKTYFTNANGVINEIEDTGFKLIEKRERERQAYIEEYVRLFAMSDESAIMLLGITRAEYEKMCGKVGADTKLSSFGPIFPNKNFAELGGSDYAEVACHARLLTHVTANNAQTIYAKIRFLLLHADLPVIRRSAVSLSEARTRRDVPGQRDLEGEYDIDSYTRAIDNHKEGFTFRRQNTTALQLSPDQQLQAEAGTTSRQS